MIFQLWRVTAVTLISATTAAVAKNTLSERMDLDRLPHDVEIDAREVTALPSHGDHHPMALAFHALNNALQMLRAVDDPTDVLDELDLARINELVTDATVHLGALHELLGQQERTIEAQRSETLNARALARRETEYSTHIEEENSRLIRRLELLAGEQARAELAAIRTSSNEPRAVAAGAIS